MQRRAKTLTGRRPVATRGTRQATSRGTTRPAARRSTRRTATAARATRRPTARAGGGRTRLSAQTTTDPELIRRWAEERGGTPATVIRSTGRTGAGILRIDFPGYSGQGTLKPITWEEWFRTFEDRNLAFLYQDRAANGELSRFSKVIRRPRK